MSLGKKVKVILNFSKRKHVITSGVATKRIVKGYITSNPIQRKENAKKIIKAIKMGKRKEGERMGRTNRKMADLNSKSSVIKLSR